MRFRGALPVVLCIILMAISVAPTLNSDPAAAAGKATDETISVPFPESDVAALADSDGLCRFSGTGLQHLGRVGEPSIPYEAVTVLLPPDADLDSVTARITGAEWMAIDGEWDVPPISPLAAGNCGASSTPAPADEAAVRRNADIYGRDALFPTAPVGKVDAQVLRQWKMVRVFYAPYAYNPVEKQIFRLSGNAVEITFERTSLKSKPAAVDSSIAGRIQEMAVNYAEMAGDYGSYAASADSGTYVIITTSTIQEASENLTDFVASKQARGFTVEVVSDNVWGGGTGDTAAEHIRSWLQDNYLSLDIKYVLLIGNPNPSTGDVPMKMCYPQDEYPEYPDCPTDFYYAELTDDWDYNDNGKCGEYDYDFPYGLPLAAEVAVGRIPYYGNITDLDRILSKVVAYESAPEADISWRRNVLLPMEPSDADTPGYQLGEQIKDDVLPDGWTYYRVYDSSNAYCTPTPCPLSIPGDTEKTPCTVTNVTNAWNGSGFGAVFWWTHGSDTSAASVMDLSHAATLDDAHPSFAFQCSCLNGHPETTNNLGYSLLKNGCISTVSASRVSWYLEGQTSFAGTATNSGMTFGYAKRLIGEQMYAGDALNDLRLDVLPGFEELWMNYLDFNLYGCPALGLSTPPLISTGDAASITDSSAQLRGNLSSLGTADNATVSFEWGTAAGGPYPNETDGQEITGTGAFHYDLGNLDPATTYYYRAKGSAWGTSYGSEKSFTTLPATPPSVTTNAAGGITATSARLNGNLTSLGTADNVTVSFDWKASGGSYTSIQVGVKTAAGLFYTDLSGLTPGGTYYFRARAIGNGTAFGMERSLTTPSQPSVTTNGATAITTGSATLNGSLAWLGAASSVIASFVWGTAEGGPYANSALVGVQDKAGAFSASVTGLTPGTTYYFRAKVENGADSVMGAEKSFTTTVTPPSVSTSNAGMITSTSAHLGGTLLSLGTASEVSVSFEWGATPGGPYPSSTAAEVKNVEGAFSASLSGLTPGTAYYFRVRAAGHGDPVFGEEKMFTTLRPPQVDGVRPGSGGLGQTLTVTISGANFAGTTSVAFGAGISVVGFTVDSSTQITATISIGCTADPGPRMVTVTTLGGTRALTGGLDIIDVLPDRPTNMGPADAASVEALTPILSSSSYSQSCPERSHSASQWQVASTPGCYSAPVFDSQRDTANLLSRQVPSGKLGNATTYYWRVRYQDDLGAWSDWSTETSFTLRDFIRAELGGGAEIRVYDSSSGMTGSEDGQVREEIACSDWYSDTVTIVSPTDSYRYQVVGTSDGYYTLSVTRVVGGRNVIFQATYIPVSPGEVHRYEIDWDALSQGQTGVTVSVDRHGNGRFGRAVTVESDIDGQEFASATKNHGTPVWVWTVAGVFGLLAAIAGLFLLLRFVERTR